MCSGPGGLRLAEFMAEKMGLRSGTRLLDIGIERGFQTCFLAKEYGLWVIGIDPDDDRLDGLPHVEHLQRNGRLWGVENQVIGLQLGVPDTHFARNTFDFVYATTTLEMIRGLFGAEMYRMCLAEVYRILRPGGIFDLGEPMHYDVPIPTDLAPIYTQGGGVGPEGWADCFATVSETAAICREVDFDVLEADNAPDGRGFERRVLFAPGLDVDFAPTPVAVFRQMLAAGLPPDVADTLRRGTRFLVDKDNLAARPLLGRVG